MTILLALALAAGAAWVAFGPVNDDDDDHWDDGEYTPAYAWDYIPIPIDE